MHDKGIEDVGVKCPNQLCLRLKVFLLIQDILTRKIERKCLCK